MTQRRHHTHTTQSDTQYITCNQHEQRNHHRKKKPYSSPKTHTIPWCAFWGIAGVALTPKSIIRSDRATIFFWKDGTKTIVRKHPEDVDNFEQAFVYAVVKKIYGNSTKGLKRQTRDLRKLTDILLPKCLE